MARTNTGWKGRQIIYGKAYPMTGIKGFEEVMRNLNKALMQVEGGTLRGLLLAAAFIRKETERNPPLTPVDTGNLRASWFTVSSKGRSYQVKDKFGMVIREVREGGATHFKGDNASQMAQEHSTMINQAQGTIKGDDSVIRVIMGYTANYAMYVHENVTANFKRPQSGAKWLEAAIKRNQWQILQIVKNNAQIMLK